MCYNVQFSWETSKFFGLYEKPEQDQSMFLLWRGILFLELWIADGEGTLTKLCPCLHDNSCVGCGGTEITVFRLFIFFQILVYS